jgi:hypothetical protein
MSHGQAPRSLHKFVAAAFDEGRLTDPESRSALSRLDGKIVRLALKDGSTIDISFKAGDIDVSNMGSEDSPEMLFEIGEETLELLIGGRMTPVEAIFSNSLKATGPADDLVMLYNTFVEIVLRCGANVDEHG